MNFSIEPSHKQTQKTNVKMENTYKYRTSMHMFKHARVNTHVRAETAEHRKIGKVGDDLYKKKDWCDSDVKHLSERGESGLATPTNASALTRWRSRRLTTTRYCCTRRYPQCCNNHPCRLESQSLGNGEQCCDECVCGYLSRLQYHDLQNKHARYPPQKNMRKKGGKVTKDRNRQTASVIVLKL